MKIAKTNIPGLIILEPEVFGDERGYFYESYNEKRFKEAGIVENFVQDNQSKSTYGVIRGLHYQINPFAQTKLVRVLEGSILDTVVDLRKKSPSFGKHLSIELSCENNKQLYVPKGFAHGFSVLSEIAVVFYKCDAFYDPEAEHGIRYDDPDLNIDWKIEKGKAVISSKDMNLPFFNEAGMNFIYE